MTAPHADRVAFITFFRDQFPGLDREACIKSANQLMRLAATHRRLSYELRDPWITPYRARSTQQSLADCEARATAICDQFKMELEKPYGKAGGFSVKFPPQWRGVPC